MVKKVKVTTSKKNCKTCEISKEINFKKSFRKDLF